MAGRIPRSESHCAALIRKAEEMGKGEGRIGMNGNKQNIVAPIEDRLRTIAVMVIDIEDGGSHSAIRKPLRRAHPQSRGNGERRRTDRHEWKQTEHRCAHRRSTAYHCRDGNRHRGWRVAFRDPKATAPRSSAKPRKWGKAKDGSA